jgi:hypothetical protein
MITGKKKSRPADSPQIKMIMHAIFKSGALTESTSVLTSFCMPLASKQRGSMARKEDFPNYFNESA